MRNRSKAMIYILFILGVGSICTVSNVLAANSNAPASGLLERTITFDVATQPLNTALAELAQQADVSIALYSDLGRKLQSRRLVGRFTTEGAFKELLAGTPLHADFIDPQSVVIRELSPATSISSKSNQSSLLHLASATGPPDIESAIDNPSSVPAPSESGPKPDESGTHDQKQLAQIVVTGTHIRGAEDSASPLQTYSRDEIARSGQPSVAAFIQSLPQNFGGISEYSENGAGNSIVDNSVSAAAADLHGLGSDATITLINGHRVAPGGEYGNIVDLSMIPLSAVDRIEVMTDGASAIYGSDAVGGVVNIILRQQYDGAETKARYGSVSNGGSHETQIGQTLGQEWAQGSGLLSYEYYDRTSLSAADRTYSEDAALPFTLLPQQVRQSAFLSLNQTTDSGIALFADGLFSHRETLLDSTVIGLSSNQIPSQITGYSGTIGGRISLSQSTDAEISTGYSSSNTRQQTISLSAPANLTDSLKTVTEELTVDGTVRGSLWSLPAGRIQYAVGGQFRGETYKFLDYVTPPKFSLDRRIVAGYLELRIPVVRSTDASLGSNRLEVSVADRDEHYSDFGSSNNPKVGLIIRASRGLKFRGTYGKSFVAPQLQSLQPPSDVVAFNTSVLPGSAPPSGDVNELLIQGGNPNLTAQTARTWTLGADFDSPDDVGIRAHLTYYGTRFSNRITTLSATGVVPYLLGADAAKYGPQIVQLNPPVALVQSLINTPGFLNYGADLSNIYAIIHGEYLNAAHVNTNGVDFDVSYHHTIYATDYGVGASGTYITKYDEDLISALPPQSIVNSTFNPLRFRARAHVDLMHGPFSASAFVNYANSYTNTQLTPAVPIASWTTIDLTGRYGCQTCSGLLGHLTATLGILNLANRNPPFVVNSLGSNVNFDGENANPLGRYYSAELIFSW